jgi:hypothetical protein
MTNILPLESWRKNFSYHPWLFWGLSSANHFPVDADCPALVYEYAYQANDSVGRTDIITAIESAESKLRDQLHYYPAPHYVTETHLMPRWYDTHLNRMSYSDATGRWLGVELNEGKVLQVGTETRAIIGNALLVYSDADGDGLNDTFTTAIATTVTDVSQIECQFATADRWDGSAAGDRWVVAPLNVTISGGMATIKGRAWQAVKPVRYEGGVAVDPANAANFVTSLDVYRHYCDPTGTTTATAQAMLIWETKPWPWFVACYGCGTPSINANSLDPAAAGYAIGRVGLRDAERGIVSVGEAIYDTTNATWQSVSMSNFRPPDRVEIRYLAGEPLNAQGHMQDRWAKVVSDFAAAELGKRVCACGSANRMIYQMQVDRAFGGDARVEKFNMTQSDDQSPFGYKEGQLLAWRNVRQLRQLGAVLA